MVHRMVASLFAFQKKREPSEGWHDDNGILLLAQYGGKAIIPIEEVCRDYFFHLTPTKLVRKISAGDIALVPIPGNDQI